MADERPKVSVPESSDAPPMPAAPSPASPSDQPLPPPPTVSRQVAQLIVIPAVIVAICVGLALAFGLMTGDKTTIDAYLQKLRQSGGGGRLAYDIQDPRYKDRGQAAYSIAMLIPEVKDPAERTRLSGELIDILKNHTSESEPYLQIYLLVAIGQLGKEGGLEAILPLLESPKAEVRKGAIGGITSWPDRAAARVAMDALIKRLPDQDIDVSMSAAAALGHLANRNDQNVIAALRESLDQMDSARQDTRFNAAVALARLGETSGSAIVADVLLDRTALGKLSNGAAGQSTLGPGMQDRIILSTLSVAGDMTDPKIKSKIELLAKDDPNPRVRKEALSLINK